MSIAKIAERAQCSELTAIHVKRGVATVAIGIYIRILFAPGLDEDILLLIKEDEVGRSLQDLEMKNRKHASQK